MARHPTMRIRDGRWQVEVLATLVASSGEVRLLGDASAELTEVRDRRSDGGR